MLKNERERLISFCIHNRLPYNVRSTSVKIYNKIHDKVNVESLFYHVLVVAAKCEECHELPFSMTLIKHECLIHEALNFEYDFSSPYLMMGHVLVKLQLEKQGDYTSGFEEGCLLMDKLLINDNDDFTDMEKAVTALKLPKDLIELFCDPERISKCSELLNL